MADAASLPQPPDDAEEWSDEQWLAWLQATDETSGDPTPTPAQARSRSLGTNLLGAAMLGMHEAIYGPREEENVMVVEAGGEPPGPDWLELELTDDPKTSKARIHRTD